MTLAQATPLAASVNIGGRVTGIDGVGVGKTRVTMVEQNGMIRTALTNPFGYYLFEDVSVGQTVTVNAAHKQFTFAPQVVSVSEDVGNLDFTATP